MIPWRRIAQQREKKMLQAVKSRVSRKPQFEQTQKKQEKQTRSLARDVFMCSCMFARMCMVH